MASDPALLSRRGRLNSWTYRYGPDDPRVVELRREVVADAITRHVRRELADVAPLTAEQRARIDAALDGTA
jgi:hypothetical protein